MGGDDPFDDLAGGRSNLSEILESCGGASSDIDARIDDYPVGTSNVDECAFSVARTEECDFYLIWRWRR